VARIEEKRAELAHLQELKELSAAVAKQMEVLEQKLATLSDGTEGMVNWRPKHCDVLLRSLHWCLTALTPSSAIAAVVGNWHNVLRAIHMASCMSSIWAGDLLGYDWLASVIIAKLASPPVVEKKHDAESSDADDVLPQTLVRIPTEHAPLVQAQADAAEASTTTDESHLAT
jgi:DASH complex subunit DAD2